MFGYSLGRWPAGLEFWEIGLVWEFFGAFLPSDPEIRSVSKCRHQSSPESLSRPVGIDPRLPGWSWASVSGLFGDFDSMLASTSGDIWVEPDRG